MLCRAERTQAEQVEVSETHVPAPGHTHTHKHCPIHVVITGTRKLETSDRSAVLQKSEKKNPSISSQHKQV